ncbi:MAG: hypothetical protein KJO55_09600 [Gammaproteobacteria bacterium]|nr:hypothetical protein [Gammaproteobacteria bacterium]NND59263.1 hypothetical protein [Gammaproteobacteria bacterium]
MTTRLLACLMLSGCATSAVVIDNVLDPGEVREACFTAATGDVITYRFEATGMVQFNMHYHDGDQVYYPIPEQPARADKGRYLVAQNRGYCLMWTNAGADSVTLDFAIDGAGSIEYH